MTDKLSRLQHVQKEQVIRVSLVHLLVFAYCLCLASFSLVHAAPHNPHKPNSARPITNPLAFHQQIIIKPEEDVMFQLQSVAAHGRRIVEAVITTAPRFGKLYQVTSSNAAGARGLFRGEEIAILTPLNDMIEHRLIYIGDSHFKPDKFSFRVTDSEGIRSKEGVVQLTLADRIVFRSDFTTNNEDWTIRFAQSAEALAHKTLPASWESRVSSEGGSQSGYIFHEFTPSKPLPRDDMPLQPRFYFNSPPLHSVAPVASSASASSAVSTSGFSASHIANEANLYGGALSFWIQSLAGDWTSVSYDEPRDFVQLHCAECIDSDGSRGVTLSQRMIDYDGSEQMFSFELREVKHLGWRKDPKDEEITNWPFPTTCEFVSVLSGLTSIRIFGGWTSATETIAINRVALITGDGVPKPCYN